MTDMTESTARRELKARLDEKRWSYDTLYADIRAVLKIERLSPRTVARFVAGTHKSHKHTVADITAYLEKCAKRKVAA